MNILTLCECLDYTSNIEGKYVCNNASITIKPDNKVFFQNVDFSEAQKEFDAKEIDVNLNELAKNDISYEIADNDTTKLFVLTSDVLVLNMTYNYEEKSIVFLNNIYVLNN